MVVEVHGGIAVRHDELEAVAKAREDAARIQVAAESLCEMVFLYAKGGQP